MVEALRRRPTLNSQWSEEGVVLKRDINLGIAVALEENLVVPVLRHADRLSIAGLAEAMADLGERARRTACGSTRSRAAPSPSTTPGRSER